MLQRIRELAVQYANGTTSEADKEAIESETEQLKEEIKRVGETTTFNGVELLEGGEAIAFQVGANEEETIEVKTIELDKAIERPDRVTEIKSRSTKRSTKSPPPPVNSVRCRTVFSTPSPTWKCTAQNLSSAVSGIIDVNMAAEMTNFTKEQVLQQAGVSILAQANQLAGRCPEAPRQESA